MTYILFLHPLGIDCSPLHFTFFSALKHSFMVVEYIRAVAPVFTSEPSMACFATRFEAFLSVGVVIMTRMLTQTLQIL